ncbi:hypothetical protein [Amycolatopsis sp. NPDC004378]
MRIIIGLIVFVALWMLYLIGYRVTAPPDPVAPAPSTSTCPPTTTSAPSATATPSGGGAAVVARPARGWPCPAVTATMTVTAVPADQ